MGMYDEDLMGAELHEVDISDPVPLEEVAAGIEQSMSGEGGEDSEEYGQESIQATIQRQLEEAVQHFEEDIEPDAVKATDYYFGREFGDEEEGRSKVVMTQVRDATLAQLPSLMRIFHGPERVVEFEPDEGTDPEVARLMTEYVHHVAVEDNPGFLIQYSAFKDALVRRLGIFKWWWNTMERIQEETLEGLSEQGVLLLAQDPNVEEIDILEEAVNPVDGQSLVIDARVRYKRSKGRACYAAVPREEFIYTPNARSLESAPLVAHVREVPREELIAMGIDEAEVERAEGRKRSASSDDLENVRQHHRGESRNDHDREVEPSQEPVVYAEAYALCDADGDGIAERRLFQCIGNDFKVVNRDDAGRLGEVVDEVPFAVITPDPEPHTLEGLSNYDTLKDVQRVTSHIMRNTLDSLAEATSPQTEVVEGEVNMQDLMNPEVSRYVRVRKPGMMREIEHEFVGPKTLPMLQFWDEIKENRTGISKAAAGLDADSLQSATKAAVAATLSGAQQHIELIARVFAETGMKRLYRGLLRLVIEHQNDPRLVRLGGEHIEVDPRSWDAEADVRINVALGQGPTEERVAVLAQIYQEQKELMANGSPLVTNVELRRTLDRLVRMAGFANPEEFFVPWGPEQEQQLQQQMAENPPPPDPATMMVEVERMKAEHDARMAELEYQLEEWKAKMEDDRERDKMARDFVIKELEIEAKHAVKIDDNVRRQSVQRERAQLDADVKKAQAKEANAKRTVQDGGDSG